MNRLKLLSLGLVFGILFAYSQNKKTYSYPMAQFDATEAAEMLGVGNITIEGVASTKQNASVYGIKFKDPLRKSQKAKAGTLVLLIPCTDYFYEWQKVKKKDGKKKNVIVVMSDEAFYYRKEAKTDAEGKFIFTNMKPGKYYLEAVVDYKGTGAYRAQTGRIDFYDGMGYYTSSENTYETRTYRYTGKNVESKIIEIKDDGKTVVKVKL